MSRAVWSHRVGEGAGRRLLRDVRLGATGPVRDVPVAKAAVERLSRRITLPRDPPSPPQRSTGVSR